MPAAIPVGIGLVALAVEAISVPAFFALVAVSAASFVLTEAMRPSESRATDMTASGGQQLQTHMSPQAPLPLAYGICRLGVNIVYIGTSGVTNNVLHVVGTLCEGPVSGIVSAAAAGETTSAASTSAKVFLNDRHFSEFGNSVYWEFYTGSSSQTVCGISAYVPEFTDPMRYTSYIYMRLEYNRDLWNGVPDVTVELNGATVYDPTADSTAYSANPALVSYDMLTRPSVRGGMGLDVWGGPVPGTPRINTDSVDDALDYCAAKGWTANMPLVSDNAFTDNLAMVLSNFRGTLRGSQTLFYLGYRDLNYEAVVMSFTEDEILTDGEATSLSVSSAAGLSGRPNAIRAVYLSQQAASSGGGSYQPREYVYVDSTALAADGDYREHSIQLLGLSDLDLVQQMSYYTLERLRNPKQISVRLPSRAQPLEAEDLIQVTHSGYGWSTKKFRVTGAAIMSNGEVNVVAVEEADSLYDDAYQSSDPAWYDTTLPDPWAQVPSVLNTSIVEEVYYYRNRSFTKVKIDFEPPAATVYPFWDYAEIWLSVGGEDDYRYMTKSTTDYVLDPVQEGEIYFFKVRSVNIFGAKESLTNCTKLSKTIVGKTTSPSDLTAMTVVANGDTVSIYAVAVDDPDVEGYEVRLGDAWNGGIFISFNKAPSLRISGVRPGTHTFWMSPRDNAGNYSGTPVSGTVMVFIPPGYTELATYGTWNWDYDGIGSHDNTEHATYDASDTLKCSHEGTGTSAGTLTDTAGVDLEDTAGEALEDTTGDVGGGSGTGLDLEGSWTSPQYDLGAIEDVRVWGDFQTAFVSGQSTWDGLLGTDSPSTRTWDDVLTATTTWNEVFEPAFAAKLTATLYFSTNGSDWTAADYFEILSADIQARYVKVKITIEDPTEDSNLYVYSLDMYAYEGPQELT